MTRTRAFAILSAAFLLASFCALLNLSCSVFVFSRNVRNVAANAANAATAMAMPPPLIIVAMPFIWFAICGRKAMTGPMDAAKPPNVMAKRFTIGSMLTKPCAKLVILSSSIVTLGNNSSPIDAAASFRLSSAVLNLPAAV